MKTKTILMAVLALLCANHSGFGQQEHQYEAGGLLFNQFNLTPTDIFRLSELGTQFGTARSTAMGGAFTSLGADASAMHINPAGLGMYRSSEISLTPMLTIGKLSSTEPFFIRNGKNSKTRFAPANISGVINMYEGSGTLTSFNFGFGYNRLADFNTNNLMDTGLSSHSITDAWALQLKGLNAAGNPGYSSYYMNEWAAIMAVRSGLIEEDRDNPGSRIYKTYKLAEGDEANQAARINSTGSVGEYNVSAGFNFGNKVYFGMTIGIQDYRLTQTILYDEIYHGDPGTDEPMAVAMFYDQKSRIRGTGVNFKAGLTYRPINPLRIGFAVHTPTYATVKRSYQGFLTMEYEDLRNSNTTPYDEYEYDFSTPVRILTGISYTFGDYGLLSFDYERSWYNSMRYTKDDNLRYNYNAQMKRIYKPSNIFRIGAEVRPTDLLSVRAGATFATTPVDLDTRNFVYNAPVSDGYYNITAGLGYRLGRHTTLDVAYVYNRTKYANYLLYNYLDRDYEFYAAEPTQTLKRSTVLATIGFRF